MNWYFDNKEHAETLIAACKEWEGTPFREGLAKRGVGVDCAHFVREVFRDSGVDTSAFDACPRISLNAGRLSSTSLLIEWLHSIGKDGLKRIDGDQPAMCGDILCVKDRLSCNHIALAVSDEWAWHIPYGGCVVQVPVSRFRPSRKNFIECIFRLKENYKNV